MSLLQKSNRRRVILAVLFAPLLILALEALNPGALSPDAFIFSAALFTGVFAILALLLNSLFAAGVTVALPLTALYIGSYYRRRMTGFVLSPSDLSLAKRLGNILGFTTVKVYPEVIFAAIAVVALTLALLLLEKGFEFSLRKRMTAFSCALGFTFIVVTAGPIPFYESANLLYSERGVAVGFLNLTAQALSPSPIAVAAGLTPDDILDDANLEELFGNPQSSVADLAAALYSDELMAALSRKYGALQAQTPPGVTPDIIVIMSEAFTDPKNFPNTFYTKNPTKTFDSITDGHRIITPTFGGGTCNPEYEFLTGNLMLLSTPGAIPFEAPDQYIPAPDIHALPYSLKNLGYRTVAVHPYHRDFFNRDTIYPRLGFDSFITDNSMGDAPKKGLFISDDYFVDTIVNELNNTREPLFLFGISMENHYEYYDIKFRENEYNLNVTSDLNEELNGGLHAYAQGIYDADVALNKLLAFLESYDRPAVLFYFGDHLPLIGTEAMPCYTETGFIEPVADLSALNTHDRYKMFTTPYALWANYDMGFEIAGDLSSFYIGAMLLEAAKLPKPEYFAFLYENYEVLRAAIPHLYVNGEGELVEYATPEMRRALVLLNCYQKQRFSGENMPRLTIRIRGKETKYMPPMFRD